jgi:uncharacterized protein (DUF427 family)
MKAVWRDTVLADSEDTVVVEGNHYFPREALQADHFSPSATQTSCHWKGTASYLSVAVNGAVNTDAAWFYPDPLPAADQIRGRVAFWKGVEVVDS